MKLHMLREAVEKFKKDCFAEWEPMSFAHVEALLNVAEAAASYRAAILARANGASIPAEDIGHRAAQVDTMLARLEVLE